MSLSSHSSHTHSGRNSGNRPIKDESIEDSINLDHLDIPELASDHSFDFMNEEEDVGEGASSSAPFESTYDSGAREDRG